MKIENNKSIALAYVLKVEGEVIETVSKEEPMCVIFGHGYLLPKFEENIKGKKVGDAFDFELKAADAYGEIDDDAFVELPKSLFEVDGNIDENLFTVGNVIPMRDSHGNRLNGTVDSASDAAIVMNFNHPLAGCNLDFTGEVVDVHDMTPEELEELQNSCNHSNCSDCHCHCG
ncbi:MAG: FKBP-type peptidyl-prolyl cis-trans isomerase [Prevotellaceae bacterium]|jgi:FKBP-type peptidyl-prolyl cis-trans isomerase SlyD|nr:FKBP-type peptidyl-prolyl cis-trans isomerase [Prevotellaceae bacterium]